MYYSNQIGQVASWKQATKIWGFCRNHGNLNADWSKMAQDGDITRAQAHSIVGHIFAKEHNKAAFEIANFIPDFKLQGKTGAKTKTVKEPVEPVPVKEPTIHIDDLSLEPVEPVMNGLFDKTLKETEDKLAQLKEAHKKEEKERQVALEAKRIEEEKKKIEPEKFNPKTLGYVKPDIFDEVCAYVKAGIQVYIDGEPGCGKTRMFSEIGKVLKKDFYSITLSGGLDSYDVFGSTQLVGEKTEFVLSEFMQKVQKKGIILADELSGMSPDVALGLNCLLEPNTREKDTPKGIIKVHKDCVFVAAGNTKMREISERFTGAQRQDDSLLDRFITLHMDYDKKVEKELVKKSKVDSGAASYFLDKLEKLRTVVRQNEIKFSPSTRRLIGCIKAYKTGVSKERAFEVAFLFSLTRGERKKVEGGLI